MYFTENYLRTFDNSLHKQLIVFTERIKSIMQIVISIFHFHFILIFLGILSIKVESIQNTKSINLLILSNFIESLVLLTNLILISTPSNLLCKTAGYIGSGSNSSLRKYW
ncbi:hypothetical protein FHS68_003286 [Dyadobacter arcticus]|uniref:G-protein coupled receptors family 1 profile domain-containing protein n=1 Tax=Dyadobacter arcticus TaxID=1078754 RepID=A0ABX0UPQ3_9BACT|nr:hypothetical protein [Dyadobacter arcticus]